MRTDINADDPSHLRNLRNSTAHARESHPRWHRSGEYRLCTRSDVQGHTMDPKHRYVRRPMRKPSQPSWSHSSLHCRLHRLRLSVVPPSHGGILPGSFPLQHAREPCVIHVRMQPVLLYCETSPFASDTDHTDPGRELFS